MTMTMARRTATTAMQQLRFIATTSSNPRSLELHQSIVQGMGKQALGIPIRSDNVQVLSTPSSFYESLKQAASDSKHRISVASLYLGSGRLERDLLDVIADNVIAKPSLRATFLFDALRSTRPTGTGLSSVRSSDMLSDRLVSKCKSSDRIRVSLYQTPDLNRALKLLLPYRVNEVVGVCHLKAYVFDDDVLISGANLSETYFTNRQDRYIWLRNSKQLADFFADLIDLVSTFSYKVQGDDGRAGKSSGLGPRYEQQQQHRLFVLQRSMVRYVGFPSSTDGSARHSPGRALYALAAQKLDSRISSSSVLGLLQLDSGARKCGSEANVTLLEQANGFYGASGVSGYIPQAYSLLEKGLYERGKQWNNGRTGLYIHEYQRPDWTFHAKGLWCSLPDEEAPSMSLIGSSNFGYRSRHRDLEAQLFIVTLDPNLL